tara:strand:- start:6354 stop:6752 length:399 start_codon:yes stop_codon:yes gene_type:complete
MEKSIFIRTDEEVWSMAHTIAKAESRSLNQQLIYMIKAKYQEMGFSNQVGENNFKNADRTPDATETINQVKDSGDEMVDLKNEKFTPQGEQGGEKESSISTLESLVGSLEKDETNAEGLTKLVETTQRESQD